MKGAGERPARAPAEATAFLAKANAPILTHGKYLKHRGGQHTSGEQLDILQAQLDYEEESGSEEESEQGLLLAAEWESVSAEQVPSLHSQSSLATAVSNTVSQLLWGPSLSPATNKK